MSDSMVSFTLTDLEDAAQLVHRVLPPTPQYVWPKLNRRAGCTVWVKHENHTPTGAFKVRGGIVYLHHLVQSQPELAGVVTATRGNHGQSIAFAAKRAGIPATIYVPHGNSPDQNSAMTVLGATVIESGTDFDEARHEARAVASLLDLHFIPAFHRHLVAGVASYALEFFRAAPDLHTVYVGVGGGSGICGLIAARDLLQLKTEIVGVCPSNAPATIRSFLARQPVAAASALTFADGLATREPNADAVEVMCRGAARVVEVSEDAIAEAIRIYYDDTHQIAEGAGAAPLAALLQESHPMAKRQVGVILSGGNLERARLLRVLSGSTPLAA